MKNYQQFHEHIAHQLHQLGYTHLTERHIKTYRSCYFQFANRHEDINDVITEMGSLFGEKMSRAVLPEKKQFYSDILDMVLGFDAPALTVLLQEETHE